MTKPFWEESSNSLLIKDPQIIRGMNLVWWFFILNAIPRDIRNRLRADVNVRFEALKEQLKNYPQYLDNSGLANDCKAFLSEDFSQEFFS